MRSPLLVMGVSFSILAIAAGCGGSSGGSSNPATAAPTSSATSASSPTSSPSSSSNPSTSPSSSSSPSVTWTFGGSTDSVTFTQGQVPVPASLAAYHGVAVTATFVASTSGGGKVNFSDALNGAQSVSDVTPNTLTPDNATTNYTPIIYVSIVNTGSQAISFGTSVPTIQLADTSLTSYTTCELDVYGSQGNGSTSSWFTVPNTGTPNASGVTVGGGALTGGNTVDFKAGNQQIVAVSCH